MGWIQSIGCGVLVCLQVALSALPLVERRSSEVDVIGLSALLGVPQGSDLVTYTQTHWLRTAGKERWEMGELGSEQRAVVLSWADSHGIYATWGPSETRYDAALVFGASTGIMRARLDYLIELWNRGIRFDQVVFLVGERPLSEAVDDLFGICPNEAVAASYLASTTNFPLEMRKLPVLFVSVPMKITQEGKKIRPTTGDTLHAWLKEKSPQQKKVLFVSNQPFNGYQYAVTEGVLPEEILFEVVGPGIKDPAQHPLAATITLDSLARWLYQERQNQRSEAP